MATIDGAWDCEVQSPMGAQKLTITVAAQPGGGFTGTASGPLGALALEDGQVKGDRITFTMGVTMPFPMSLACEARLVDDDHIEGTVDTGAFGRYPMKAARKV